MKYSVLALTVWGVSACTAPRTIILDQTRTQPVYRPSTVHRPSSVYRPPVQQQQPVVVTPPRAEQPVVREEILLGEGSANSDLGQRVDVPQNHPTVEVNTTTEVNENVNSEMNRPSSREVLERIPFPLEEYQQLKKRGSSTVSGTIYLENANTGEKIRGKKVKLWLNPVTSYSRQWYEEAYLGGYKLSKADKRLYNYLKFTYSDSSGKFDFFGVPRGAYYLTGTVSCANECGFNGTKSIRLVEEISVGRGVTHVDLTKQVP